MTAKKQQIEVQLERLAKQRAFIRREKRKLLLQNALLESERERFEASLSSDWFCSSAFPSARDRRVTIDVGGQLFEISSALAAKDSGSLLAAFVDEDSPLSETECGCFRVDRDWWLFRYVLTFLRDGVLPQDPKMLRELYLESEFWKLESLRRAIEMRNMELLQMKQEGNKPETTKKADSEPSSAKVSAFASLLKKKKAKSEMEPSMNEQDAWWKSATYKGVDFNQALSPEKKVQAAAGDSRHQDSTSTPRIPLVVNSTWSSSHHIAQ